ncbi:hypothetical protein Tco_0466508, partial [Tanacetum coccineum]
SIHPEAREPLFTNLEYLYQLGEISKLTHAASQVTQKSLRCEKLTSFHLPPTQKYPRHGLVNVDNSTFGEIEHFMDSKDSSRPKYSEVSGLKVPICSRNGHTTLSQVSFKFKASRFLCVQGMDKQLFLRDETLKADLTKKIKSEITEVHVLALGEQQSSDASDGPNSSPFVVHSTDEEPTRKKLKVVMEIPSIPNPILLNSIRPILEKKRKRRVEVMQEVFFKENIMVVGMQRNLVPPQRVIGSAGLIDYVRIQVKDIVKEVKDYLRTYSSVEMDISWIRVGIKRLHDDIEVATAKLKLVLFIKSNEKYAK